MAPFNGNFYSQRFSIECVCPKCIQLIPNYCNFIFYIALRWTSIWNITSYISYYQRICAWKGSNLLKELKGGVNGEHNYCYHEILKSYSHPAQFRKNREIVCIWNLSEIT